MWLVQCHCRTRRRIRRRPVVTSCPAALNSRSRRQRGSHSRALPVSASIGIRASRSRATCTISSQLGGVGQRKNRRPVHGRPGCSPRPSLAAGDGARVRRSAGPMCWWRNRSAACRSHPERQLGPRSLLADNQPHALRPAVQDATGEFGDPGAVADLAVRSVAGVQAEAGTCSTCCWIISVITMPTE